MDRTKAPSKVWLTLILSLLAFLAVFAQPVTADNQDVLDQANVLSASTQAKIKSINDNELSKIKGHPQIAVVTRNSLAGTKADDIDEYGQHLFDKYHFGRKGYDNGILIVILVQDHKMRIQTGYGVEAAVPDLYTNDVVSDEKVKDSFREDNFDAGTTRMVSMLMHRLQTHQADLRSPQAVGVNNVLTKAGTALAVVPYILFGLTFLFYRPKDDSIVYRQGQVIGWLAHVGLPLVFLFYLSFLFFNGKVTAYVTVGMLAFQFLYLSLVGWQNAHKKENNRKSFLMMQFIRAFAIALVLSFFTKRFSRYVLAVLVIYLALMAIVWVTYLLRNKQMAAGQEKQFNKVVADAHLTSEQREDLDWFTTSDKLKVLEQATALTGVLTAVHQRHAIFNALTWLERQANFTNRKSKSHDHSDANSSLTWYDISDHDDYDSGGDFGGFGGSSGGGGSDGSW